MAVLRAERGRWVHLRRCRRCGHGGPELQRGHDGECVFICPACGQDLYARPPMSYAEMEGLPPLATPGGTSLRATRGTGLLGRCFGGVLRLIRGR